MELGELEESHNRLTNALKVDPENTKIISNLGILELKRDNPSLARSFFLAVLQVDENDPLAKKYLELLS